jgi:hypothetical protein
LPAPFVNCLAGAPKDPIGGNLDAVGMAAYLADSARVGTTDGLGGLPRVHGVIDSGPSNAWWKAAIL